jgi:peptidoglycan/LPS O-acetylase OafA/YrhL
MAAPDRTSPHGVTVTSFPGFDGIRLLASLSVLLSHAYLIAENSEARDPGTRLFGEGQILGLYGVYTFFIISGFLLARSLSRDGNALSFTRNRVLRIVPGFVFSAAVVALVIGPLVTTQPLAEYFRQPATFRYIAGSLRCFCDNWEAPFQWPVAGTMAKALNGSLWSLSFEVLSYMFLLWLWVLLRNPARVAAALVAVALATMISKTAAQPVLAIAATLPYFAAGVSMFVVHRRFGTHKVGAIAAGVLLVAAAVLGVFEYAYIVFGTYLVVFFAGRSNPGSRFARRAGDLSYGVYLFGWPIEQFLQIHIGASSGEVLFVYAIPSTLAIAAISWWVVERPFMRLKGSAHTLAVPTLGFRRAPTPLVAGVTTVPQEMPGH